jgi:outer membrane murein-binding lipoprotein Lpp
MITQTVAAATRDVLESGRKTVVNGIHAGHGTARGALKACNRLTATGADMLATVPTMVATAIREEVVSVEGQITLLAGMLAQTAADSAENATNRAAKVATGSVDTFERVFDLRVRDALVRVGAPSSELIQELALRVSTLAKDVERLSDLLQPLAGKKSAAKRAQPAAKARAKSRTSTRAVKRS